MAKVVVWSVAFLEGYALPREEPLVQAVVSPFSEVTGKSPDCIYDPSVCDASYFAKLLGIPVVAFGPSGENWHKPSTYYKKCCANRSVRRETSCPSSFWPSEPAY